MKNVLVTGGTGTFGKAFVRDALRGDVERLVVFSRDELKQSQMRAAISDPRVRYVIGDVENVERLLKAMRDVDTVIHAAAMKQIDTCELNPVECVRTNVMGTISVIDAALKSGVRKCVFLSTDKAAAPNTHYGACKLVAERVWTQANVYAAGTPTRFSATRYGNVLGSRGSVVEVWRNQIAEGITPTITDPAMSRFWMTIGDAVELVKLAAAKMRGGEVFVPKVGAAPVTSLLVALDRRHDVPYDVTGIRRGEKLHETLISEEESRHTLVFVDHYRIEPDRTWEDFDRKSLDDHETVDGGWSYRSDTARQLSVDELRGMLE
jgi:UDP-N-acetylglucosamine 4,6-dehydratase